MVWLMRLWQLPVVVSAVPVVGNDRFTTLAVLFASLLVAHRWSPMNGTLPEAELFSTERP
jgi:hypothetical protein